MTRSGCCTGAVGFFLTSAACAAVSAWAAAFTSSCVAPASFSTVWAFASASAKALQPAVS